VLKFKRKYRRLKVNIEEEKEKRIRKVRYKTKNHIVMVIITRLQHMETGGRVDGEGDDYDSSGR
jgi:hypothetical protein